MKEKLEKYISTALEELGITGVAFTLEHPADLGHGDWATNAAMAAGKRSGKNPRALAEEIVGKLKANEDADIISIDIAGPGFINVKLSNEYFAKELASALDKVAYGVNESLLGKNVVVEYTDPNPFKEFHIGHLMPNVIGESIARLIEASGAETRRACYQGDVGMHVAKAIRGIELLGDTPSDDASLEEKAAFLGRAYARGATAFEESEEEKAVITKLNKTIYERSDAEVVALYEKWKDVSLDQFEVIYKELGTKFDYYFFESETGEIGREIVRQNTPSVFEASDGAVVFKGEESLGLHTRVFINNEGLPTYEAKELGLAKVKYERYPYDISVVVTANEINDYFKVLLAAMEKVFPELAKKTVHIGHGILRLPTGKMSSRTGDVITARSLLADVKERAKAKITNLALTDEEKAGIVDAVSVAAIKYSILRQAAGRDIIFDFEQSLSFEGDSGPYLQYTYARTASLLRKAGEKMPDASFVPETIRPLHKFALRFPEIVERSAREYAPHHLANYLVELAREFNAFYGNTLVLDGASDEGYKLALVALVSNVLRQGLGLLGIPVLQKM